MKLVFPKFLLLLFLLPNSLLKAQVVDAMLDVGHHKLHFRMVPGKGMPILFEAGNGDDGSVWAPMLQQISEATGAPLIVYDRAGLGKSEIDTSRTDFLREVKDLEKLLRQMGLQQELFLVTHSFGNVYGTEFARRGKFKVKGAVFIEPAAPCNFTPEWSRNFTDNISDSDWQMIKQYKRGLYHVLQNLEDISRRMARKPLPAKLPVTVIVAETPPSMLEAHEVDGWKACLEAFGSVPHRRLVVAEDCGHKVWENDLGLVVNEIVRSYQSQQH